MEKLVLPGGEELWLRAEYRRVVALEERTGMGVMAIAQALAEGMLPLAVMTAMVAVFSGREETDLGERLLTCGVAHVAEVLVRLLKAVLGGGHNDASELAGLMARFPDQSL